MKKFLSLGLLFSLVLSACDSNDISNISLISEEPQGLYEVMNRPEIGGSVYQNLKVTPTLPKDNKERKAVKLTYLMTDDEAHQSPWSGKMFLMMDDLEQKNVHNVVFRDGGQVGDSQISYLIKKGTDPEKVENAYSYLSPNVKEVQSNNPRLFSRIVEWTFDNYKGSKKYLQIYTHGGGVFGIGMDAHQTDLAGTELEPAQKIGIMSPQNFGEALKQGLKGRKLDLIYFRACLMGNLEALYELRDTTKYVLASEDVSYSKENSNIIMTKMFEDLASKDTDPKEVAYQMAIQGNGKKGSSGGYTTFAAFDISKVDELKTAVNELSLSLKSALNTEKEAIISAYDSVPTIKGEEITDSANENQRDLWRFTAELDKKVQSESVKKAVQRVRSMQKGFMIHEKDTFGSSANGLSIFMPFRENLAKDKPLYRFLTGNYTKRKFVKDSAWDDFLLSLPSK